SSASATTHIYTLSLHDALPISAGTGNLHFLLRRHRRAVVAAVSGALVGLADRGGMWLRAQPGTVILRIARRQSGPGHGAFGDGPEHRLPAGSPGPLLPRTAARYQRALALGTGDHAGAAIVPPRLWLVRGPPSQCGAGRGTPCQFLTMQVTRRSTPSAGWRAPARRQTMHGAAGHWRRARGARPRLSPGLQQGFTHPGPRELPGTPPVAVAPGGGPADGFLLQLLVPSPRQPVLRRQTAEPVPHHVQVVFLTEGIEGHPQPETVGQRDLLLDRRPGVQLAVDHAAGQVVAALLRQQMSAVGGGVQQQIVRGRFQRAVQYRLQRLVGTVIGLEGQIIAEHQKTPGLAA